MQRGKFENQQIPPFLCKHYRVWCFIHPLIRTRKAEGTLTSWICWMFSHVNRIIYWLYVKFECSYSSLSFVSYNPFKVSSETSKQFPILTFSIWNNVISIQRHYTAIITASIHVPTVFNDISISSYIYGSIHPPFALFSANKCVHKNKN